MAKTWNALIYPHQPTTISERRLIDVSSIPPHKLAWWRPIVKVGDDPYNAATQVKTGPVTTIEADRVVDTWTIRNKTQAELDSETDENREGDLNIGRVALLIGFDHENRIRVLEGKSTITAAQYRAAIKARI